MLSRIVYLFLFSVICAISIAYIVNDDKARIKMGDKMRANQRILTELTAQIYKAYNKCEELSFNNEIEKKEYIEYKDNALKDMNMEIASLMAGKSKEEMVKQETKGAGWLSKAVGIAVFTLLIGRWIYTKMLKKEDGGAEVIDFSEMDL